MRCSRAYAMRNAIFMPIQVNISYTHIITKSRHNQHVIHFFSNNTQNSTHGPIAVHKSVQGLPKTIPKVTFRTTRKQSDNSILDCPKQSQESSSRLFETFLIIPVFSPKILGLNYTAVPGPKHLMSFEWLLDRK